VRSEVLKTTVVGSCHRRTVDRTPQMTLRLNIKRRLSLKCLFLGHEDWIRRTSDRLYLECFECGRETPGWATGRRDVEGMPSAEVCHTFALTDTHPRVLLHRAWSRVRHALERYGEMLERSIRHAWK
jgi:hypothetical protein